MSSTKPRSVSQSRTVEDLRRCVATLWTRDLVAPSSKKASKGRDTTHQNASSSTGPSTSSEVTLDGESLTLEQLLLLGEPSTKILVSQDAVDRMRRSRKVITDSMDSKRVVYGINTGFGRLSSKVVDLTQLAELQVNLIRSHATGVGAAIPNNQAKRVMALRINTLLKGCSGVSEDTFTKLVAFFNSGLIPYVRAQGTVGASGDLVPLAHIALNVIGEGQCYSPKIQSFVPVTDALLREYNLTRATLQAKDGLALINGTQFICGVGAEAVGNAVRVLQASHIAAAVTLTALQGHPEAYDAQIHSVRGHPGQIASAALMRAFLPPGCIKDPNRFDCQDPYSLRCLPQVHGPVVENVERIKRELEIEINAATDNPLIFGDTQRMISGGNFHAEYVAKALDCLAIYVHELSSISYSRLMRVLNPHKNNDSLPTFLIRSAGLSSGFMTWENVSASLVSENKVLCHPSSVDSLSTCADKEDHVSMGGMSARKAVQVSENVAKCITIELMAGIQALYLLTDGEGGSPIRLPPMVQCVFEFCKPDFAKLESDRYLVPEFDRLYQKVISGELFDHIAPMLPSQSDAEEGTGVGAAGGKQAKL
ncbi:unnamed protein product [Amoebophrya sp. A25]|nr:unnamed protein product [Amoebophrya sp. A25]|eukprot:GSA25T00003334001.1